MCKDSNGRFKYRIIFRFNYIYIFRFNYIYIMTCKPRALSAIIDLSPIYKVLWCLKRKGFMLHG